MVGGLIIIGAVTLIVLTPPAAASDPDTSSTAYVRELFNTVQACGDTDMTATSGDD